jgi:hypothetical protein
LENAPIEILDISDNSIKTIAIEKLGNLMKNKNLKVLKISDCNIGSDVTDIFGDILR